MSNEDITVVMNGYRRKDSLNDIFNSVQNQTVKAKEIMLWYNFPGSNEQINFDMVNKTTCALSNKNHGVWARFAYALNATTKYVCVFDDDTVPGNRWFENCLNTMKTHRGLLGTVGLICHDKNDYYRHTRIGWPNPNRETRQVDLVGHSWFFEREWLSAMFAELPDPKYKLCGEDMNFSYSIQKYLNLNTYVPPHPTEDKSLWGSLKGWELGVDVNAISHMHLKHGDSTFVTQVNEYYRWLISKNWKLVNG